LTQTWVNDSEVEAAFCDPVAIRQYGCGCQGERFRLLQETVVSRVYLQCLG